MGNSSFHTTIVKSDVGYNDDQLLSHYKLSQVKLLNNQNKFEKKLRNRDDNRYLDVYLARLAYEFAKEENGTLFNEILKRGLITLEKGA